MNGKELVTAILISSIRCCRSSDKNVTFLNRVPVRLTVTDQPKCSSVTLPDGVLGIRFSYSQHSKRHQLPQRAAGFYWISVLYGKILGLTLASLDTRVKLVNGLWFLDLFTSVGLPKIWVLYCLSTSSTISSCRDLDGFPLFGALPFDWRLCQVTP